MSQETPFCQWRYPWTSNSYQRMSQETCQWGIPDTVFWPQNIPGNPFCQWGILQTQSSALSNPGKSRSISGESPVHHLQSSEYPGKPSSVSGECPGHHLLSSVTLGNPLLPRGIPRTPPSVLRRPQETPFSCWGIRRTLPSAFRIYREMPFCQWGVLWTPSSLLKFPKKSLLSVGNPPDTTFCP